MKLLVMQLSPPSRHSIPLWSIYSPQHPKTKTTRAENIKIVLGNWERIIWSGLIWLRIGIGGGCFEHGNKATGSIKFGEIPE
jgi:hypothetical protein